MTPIVPPRRLTIQIVNETKHPYRMPSARIKRHLRNLREQANEACAGYSNASSLVKLRWCGHLSNKPRANRWIVRLLDAHDPDTLGYHEWDAENNRAIAYLYCRNLMTKPANWQIDLDFITKVMSHEILEMLMNPGAGDTAYGRFVRHDHGGGDVRDWLREIADPVENSEVDYYRLDSKLQVLTLVADYVLENWFFSATGVDTDKKGHLNHHHKILAGGECLWRDDDGWHEQDGPYTG